MPPAAEGAGGGVVGEQRLRPEQQRLLRVIGQMPLAAASDLAPILGPAERVLARRLARLRRGGWLGSIRRGMTRPPQRRWFLTGRAVAELYMVDHTHLGPRELARGDGRLPVGQAGRRGRPPLALDHEHLGHLTDLAGTPFRAPLVSWAGQAADVHEHPPWTATARGLQVCLRRLAMLETIYQLAPRLARDGLLRQAEWREAPPLSDFRLLRRSGHYVALARYGRDYWTPFSYAGLHATERILRRKQQHRFWNLDCYSGEQQRVFQISNRVFYEDPDQAVEPSALVVVAADRWAAELARATLGGATPTLICTPDRRCSAPVDARRSRDLVSDPQAGYHLGRPERLSGWLRRHPDLEALNGELAYRLFLLIAQFPGMRPAWLSEIAGVSASAVGRALGRFVETGLAARYEGRLYLAEAGMRRAANLSRIRPAVVRSRHGRYLRAASRRRELRHDDGLNRLVVGFAREGVEAFAGWRGELNLPGLTQVRPDLLLLVSAGPFGSGPHAVEYERRAVERGPIELKLGPYRRAAAAGRPLPVLFVCETERAVAHFLNARRSLPLLAATESAALTGPLTGERTVWSEPRRSVRLRCDP